MIKAMPQTIHNFVYDFASKVIDDYDFSNWKM